MSIQTRNNPFLVMAGLYLTVGLIAIVGKLTVDAGIVDTLPRLRWLTIHFVTIGGLTQALFGMLPSVTNSLENGEPAVSSRDRWLQWLALNAGYPLILLGMATGNTDTAVVGATLVLGALLGLVVTIYRVGSSDGARLPYFRTAPWFLVVGILAAFGMLLNVHGPGGYFGSIEAHVHANVWGFLALVVAGVLLTLLPRLFDTTLRYPQLQKVTYWGITVGAAGLVAGPWLARHELTMFGLGVYVVGTVSLLVNVIESYRGSDGAQLRRLALVLGAYLWLVFPVPWAPLVLLFPDSVPGAAIELSAINGLVFGWMLQLAMAFLPLAVIAMKTRESNSLTQIRIASDTVSPPSWFQIASVNLGMLLLWTTAFPPLSDFTASATFLGYLLIGVAWTMFLVDLWSALTTVPATAQSSSQSLSD